MRALSVVLRASARRSLGGLGESHGSLVSSARKRSRACRIRGAVAKPIAFTGGSTVMAEYGAGTMEELQFFYAPRYDFSFGGGHLRLDSDETTKTRNITYARLNYLVHRWNLDDAQANIFVWGGMGSATGNTFSGSVFTENAGAQADYETRRVYASLKTDWQGSSEFSASNRHAATGICTLQARLRWPCDLDSAPGSRLYRRDSQRDGNRAAAATVQGRRLGRGRRHERRQAPGHGHVQLLRRTFMKLPILVLTCFPCPGRCSGPGRDDRDERQRSRLRVLRTGYRKAAAQISGDCRRGREPRT